MDEIYLSPVMHWLLRASWQASVMIVLVLALQWIFRRQLTARWRYRLWFLVLVRLMLPMSPPSAFSLFNYFTPQSHPGLEQFAGAIPATCVQAADLVPRLEALPHVPKDAAGLAAIDSQAAQPQPDDNAMLWLGLRNASPWTQGAMFLLLVVWPAGVVFFVMKILRQNLGFALRVYRAPAMTDPRMLEVLEDCRRMLDIEFPIRLVETGEIKSPGLYGFFRPQLLVPEGMSAAFSTRELNYIFLHELAHVKRGDMAVNWLMTGLQILHWFNPIIWLGFARMRAERELACDALVLSRMREIETASYGDTIIKLLERFVCPPKVSGLVGILEEKEEMKRRITMIACFQRASQVPLFALTLFVLLGLVTLTDAKIPEARPAGLVGWWRAEDGTRDAMGVNDGKPEGHLGYKTGSPGRSFDFNGVDTEVKIPASRSLNVGRGDGFTLGAWINPDGLDQQCPIMEWNSGSGGVSFMVVEDYGAGSLYARITDVGHTDHFLISPSGLVQPYVFQHVAVTYDRLKGTGALYCNGKLVGLAFLGFFEPLTDGDLHFGLRGPGEFKITHLKGQLDELQVFNSALALPEIQTIYQAGLHGKSVF